MKSGSRDMCTDIALRARQIIRCQIQKETSTKMYTPFLIGFN